MSTLSMNTFNFKQFLIDNYHFIKNEFFVFMAAIVAPITPMLFLIGILIVTDTLSSIWAAVKRKGWGGFKSRFMALGIIPKLIFYPLAVIMAQSVETVYPEIPMLKVTGFILMSIEMKSITENYNLIFGKSVFDSLKDLLFRYTKNYNKDNPKD